MNKVQVEGDVSEFVSLLYSVIFAACMALVCGSCGFLASTLFTFKLYAAFDASMASVAWYVRLDQNEEQKDDLRDG